MRKTLPLLLLIIGISIPALFLRLGSLPLSGSDEPRYARIAQEMGEQGSWVTPLLEGKPWLEKPPLYYWITIPQYAIFENAETAARAGSALCALLTALAVFWVGSKIYTARAGAMGALILLTSLGLAGFGRSASTDMAFTCFLTLAMAVLAVAVEKPIGIRVLAAYVFLGIAVLGKGPVAVILAAGTLIFFWYFDERGGSLRRFRVITGVIVTAAVSLPWFWFAFVENGYAFISTFFINHNLARYVTDIHQHVQPFYYYLPVLLALMFPWSGWLVMLFPKSPLKGFLRRSQWHRGTLFLACWFLFPILFFSFSGSKLGGYILPSLPPLALLLGGVLSSWMEGPIDRFRFRAGIVLHLALSMGMAIAAPIFFNKDYGGNWKTGLLISAAIIIPAVAVFIYGIRGKCGKAFGATVVQGLATVVVVALFAFPILGEYHSTKTIAHKALELRYEEEPIVTYRFFHHSLHYYTGYRVSRKITTMESLRAFLAEHPRSLVVTGIEGMSEIEASGEIRATMLGEQGNFRLLRLSPAPLF
ncbi:MAG TPA: glycosyltransferase family 39 protein [Acidobacteriota bacterium]|nr:glycosyltransferase family 39 protein [Acidobacteriota bacterium]